MFNVYVVVVLRDVSPQVLEDKSWLEACWSVLPDAAMSGEPGGVGMTLSQWALMKRQAVSCQSRRVRAAMAMLGSPDVELALEMAYRSDWRDDLGLALDALRSTVERVRRRVAQS